MENQNKLKMSIMGRVYMAYAMRRVFRSSTIRAVLSVGSLTSIFSFVSVLNVIKNMTSITNPEMLYNFSISALSNTETAVQLSVVILFAAVFWFARDLIRLSLLSNRIRALTSFGG